MSNSNAQAENHTEATGKAYLIIILGLFAHAFTAPWVKQSNFDPATSAFLRCGLAALFLFPFAYSELKKLGKLNKQGVLYSLVAGLFLGVDFIAFNYSIYYVGSGVASILLNIQVIILPALAFFFDKEKIPKSYFIIAPIMVLGVAMSGGIFDGSGPTTGPATIYGINTAVLGTIAGAVSGFCYGFYLYFSRKATRVNKGQFLQPMTLSTLAQLVAPIIFMMFISDRGFDITNGVLISGDLPMVPETMAGDPITAMNWIWMIILASVGQAMCWSFIQYGSVRLNPTIVAGMLLLSPIATVGIIAVVLFGEIPSTLQIIGVVIVLGAVAIQNGVHRIILDKFKT